MRLSIIISVEDTYYASWNTSDELLPKKEKKKKRGNSMSTALFMGDLNYLGGGTFPPT